MPKNAIGFTITYICCLLSLNYSHYKIIPMEATGLTEPWNGLSYMLAS